MLILNEHAPSAPVTLSGTQRIAIEHSFAARVEHTHDGKTIVTPGSRVGAIHVDGLDIIVRPKLPVARLLTLIAEAADPYRWAGLEVPALRAHSLQDAVAALFARSCLDTFERGVVQSYRREDQQLPFVKGRMHVAAYARTPTPLPIPVTTGVFDADNLENQVLRAALDRVRTSPLVSEPTRIMAQRAWRAVAHTGKLRDPRAAVESIAWNRRNQYYRGAIALARFVLTSGSGGNLRDDHDPHSADETPGFVINMPLVIEQWVRNRLRAHWGLTDVEMPNSWGGRLWLDEARKVSLKPDLGVCIRQEWRFIGDVKYKNYADGGARPDDLYQLVSYLAATGMRTGTLVYAGAAGSSEMMRVASSGMDLSIVTIDLSAENPSDDLLAKVTMPRMHASAHS